MKYPAVELGGLVDVVMGQAPPGDACNKDGTGTIFVKAGEFQERHPVVREWTTKPLKLSKAGDVLVCVVGATAGKVNEGAFDCAIGRSVAAVRSNPQKLDARFLFHFLKTKVMQLREGSQGAAQGVITREMIFSLSVTLLPLPEQRRIAAILDQADALRAKRREALAQLDSLTQSIFIEMFGDPAANPKAWPRLTLNELMDENGPQNGLYKPSTDYGTGTPILRIDAFYDGVVTKLHSLKRVRLSASELKLYGLRINDIVINRVNSIEYLGKSALIPRLSEHTVFESNMMRFSVRRDLVEPGYVVQFLQTKFIKNQIKSCSKNAVNQSSINQQDVKSFQVNVPPLTLQRTFALRVQSVEALKITHRTALAELDTLFASLQHRAFQGDL
ncbi:restriction endonuclease subunit S [Rhodoferax fermentans]|uniref:Type I restriction modification DNA specificity domain-containing protein n=1 Tax=Rhodoferax fermentans TaxID=28066 RepID=A0A1T1ASK0_RHOFE|nr:restriction endonuclease subunit S [Rhodoferax fermentans]MBK1684217.1 hypothetical protein [Rhodoferax fermentans]OOV07084.1 hypothetical protein RF819_10410 [Rhodoferax fermentans]